MLPLWRLVLLVLLLVPSFALAQGTPILGDRVHVGHTNFCASLTGTDAYACPLVYPITAYTPNADYGFKADVANSGPATINFHGVGAVAIKKFNDNVTTDLADGDICPNQQVHLRYDGVNMQMLSPLCHASAGGGVTDGDKTDITVSFSGATWTIDPGVVTYAKMQNVSATDRLLGRDTAGAGIVEELTATAVKTMLALQNVDNTADVNKNVATAAAFPTNPLNCGAGLAAQGITATGEGEGCFDVITPAELTAAPLVPTGRLLTLQGTTNQIAVSPGTAQDLSADRTWTVSIPANPTLPGTTTGAFSGPLTGLASTASAFPTNPANCLTAGDAAAGVTAAGVAEGCFDVITPGELTTALGPYLLSATATSTYVPLTRTLTAGFGMEPVGDLSANRPVAHEAASTDDQVYVSDSTSDGTWRTLPNCADIGGQHLNYTAATNTWSCGTTGDGTGGGPAAPVQLSAATGTVTALACSTVELYYRHDLSGALTIPAFTGTCTDGQKVAFRLKPASGAALGLTFTAGASKAFSNENGLALPTFTLDSTQYVEYAFVYNSASDRFAYVGGTKATAPLGLADGGTASALTDPGDHRVLGWDNTENVTKWFSLGSGLTYDQATNVLSAPGGGSGDFSSNTSTSVDGEVVLFSGTGGKTGKRATGSGLAELTAGVLGIATPGTDYVLPSGTVATAGAFSGNPLNCTNVGDAAVGIAADGTAEGCFDVITPAELTTHTSLTTAHGSTSANTPSTIMQRDASGNVNATTFIGALTGLASTAAAFPSDPSNCGAGLAAAGITAVGIGDGCFDVATQAELDTHVTLTNPHSATSANTPDRLVLRDASGNFAAGTITAALVGNASTATSAGTATTASGLTGNPANCTTAGNVAAGIDAAGVAEGCIDPITPAELAATVFTDAQIPDLNTLSTGLAVSRCVETNGTDGKFTVTTGPCAAGGLPADPGAHGLLGWDDTGNLARWFVIGSGLTYTQATNTLSAPGGVAAAAGNTTEVQFNTGGNLAADPDFTFNTTTNLVSGKIADTGGAVYNVKAYGALGNDSANDTSAILTAYAAAGATGGILYFPPGTYRVGSTITLNQANVTWRGAGMYSSVIKAINVGTAVFTMLTVPALPTTGPTNPTFEDLGFHGNDQGAHGFVDDTSRVGTLTFQRCRFSAFGFYHVTTPLVGMAVRIYAPKVVFDSNLCEGVGNGVFNICIGLSYGASGPLTDIVMKNNRMRYIYQGMIADTDPGGGTQGIHTTNPITNVTFSNNHVDLGFYTLPTRLTGSGGTVSYTATTLVNTAGGLTDIGTADYLRVMPTRSTGTAETLGWTKLTDTAANFVSDGVLVGEIVRVVAENKFAIISAVDATNTNTLYVEEWLDDTTRAVVTPPATNSTYIVYRVILGKYASGTGTNTVTVARWHDLTGAAVLTIPAGTRYELLYVHPNYGFHCEMGCQDWRIQNNTMLRGFSDQLSYFGTRATFTGNYVAWGQDMGIVAHGGNHVIANNRLYKQGVGGITGVALKSSTISANTITNTTWTTAAGSDTAGGIAFDGIYGNVVVGNVIVIDPPGSMLAAANGIVVQSAPNDNNLVMGNQTRGHTSAGIRVDSAGLGNEPTNLRLAHNVSTSEPNAVVYDTATKVVVQSYEKKVVMVECVADSTVLTTGDGKCFVPVIALFNGWTITAVSAHVGGAVSSSGAVNVDIDVCPAVATGIRCSSGTIRDLLTTNITIDQNEDGTETAAAPAMISTVAGVAAIATGDWLRWNIDGAGTGAQGLYVSITLENQQPQ